MIAKLSRDRSTGLVVDLLMLVVGINIALWFEGYVEDQKDAETAQQYLMDLREDLLIDVRRLEDVIRINKSRIESFKSYLPGLPELTDASPDEQGTTLFAPSSYTFFQPADSTYRSMMESGDFRLLSDATIKKKILGLDRRWQEIEMLQINFLQALDDEYIPLMMRGFDIAESRITDPAIVSNQVFKNFFMYAIQDTGNRVYAYELALEQSRELLELLPVGEVSQMSPP